MHNVQYTSAILKETLKRNLQKVKGDCPDRVHSDQMVLATVRREAGRHERQPKAVKTTLAQGGPSCSSPLGSGGSCGGKAGC